MTGALGQNSIVEKILRDYSMHRIGILNIILIVSILVVLSLPLYLKFVVYPSYKTFLTMHTESALEKLATQLVGNHYIFDKHLSTEPVSNDLVSDHLIDEIRYYQEITGIPKVKIFSPDGVIVYSTDPDDLGKLSSKTFFPEMMKDGKPRSELKVITTGDGSDQSQYLLEAYVPIIVNNNSLGAFELYYDISELNSSFEKMKRQEQKILIPVAILLLFGGIISTSFARRSIKELTQAKDDFQKLSISDPLTGLLNRRGFNNAAERQLKYSQRGKGILFLIYIDLNDFKKINDNYGHESGDQALIATAKIIESTFRETDIIGRMGGDEFSVLAAPVNGLEDEDKIRQRLQEAITRWNNSTSEPYRLSFSVGFAIVEPNLSISFKELTSQADADMYRQKQTRKERS